MIASPDSSFSPSAATVRSVISPAGSMTHAVRGLDSLATKSSSESAPVAPSPASVATASGLTSKTTHSWPSRMSRRTRFAPIRPSPTMPSCIVVLLSVSRSVGPQAPVAANQVVRGRVVRERRFVRRAQLRHDVLRELLAELDTPLVERVDVPDRSLGEHLVLV